MFQHSVFSICYATLLITMCIISANVSAQVMGERILRSEIYTPGKQIKISITLTGEPGDITVVEIPPSSWRISSAMDGGQITEGSIVWNITSFTGSLNLSYTVTPPTSASGIAIFSGKVGDLEISGSSSMRNSYVYDEITSPSLEGNLLGDPATRKMVIFLPPSYHISLDKHYPVFYLLHGYTCYEVMFSIGLQTSNGIASIADSLIANDKMMEAIIVMPDARNRYNGSWYERNEVIGDYRNYIARDLVKYIDEKYRTLPDRNNRGIGGHSMGGYGALSLALEYTEVFSAVAALSPGTAVDFEKYAKVIDDVIAENTATLKSPKLINVSTDGRIAMTNIDLFYSYAAAFSPNPDNPPLYVDLPIRYPEKSIVPETFEKWCEHDLVHLIAKMGKNLNKTSIYVSRGIGPTVAIPESEGLELIPPALEAQGIACTYDEFNGDHYSKIDEQITTALKFLSNAISTTSVNSWAMYE